MNTQGNTPAQFHNYPVPPTLLECKKRREINEMEMHGFLSLLKVEEEIEKRGGREPHDLKQEFNRDVLYVAAQTLVRQTSGYNIEMPICAFMSLLSSGSAPQMQLWTWTVHREMKLAKLPMKLDVFMRKLIPDGHVPTEEGYLDIWQRQKRRIVIPGQSDNWLDEPNVWTPQGPVLVMPEQSN